MQVGSFLNSVLSNLSAFIGLIPAFILNIIYRSGSVVL